jgi:hypothetical protein
VNARGLALAGVALGMALAVTCALHWLGGSDAQPRSAEPAEKSGGAAPPRGIGSLAGALLRPGPLTPAHAHLEGAGRCTLCHGRADHVPDERCEACHEEIPARAARALPLHGRFEGECSSCHKEHGGERVPLVALERGSFSHATTRFPLHGAHAALECDECHRLRASGSGDAVAFHFQGVPFASCSACHRDPHAGGVRAAETVGPIVRVALDAPPAPARAADPAHPLAGRDCAQCHTEATFRSAGLRPDGFAHGADAHFELRGAHAGVACAACHTAGRREAEQKAALAPGSSAQPTCGSCHRDPHQGALGKGERCATCHSPERWNAGFDHARDTRFALDELHAGLRCQSCHSDQRFRAAGRTCETCHADAAGLLAGRFDGERGEPDPHQGALRCTDCHGPTRAANQPGALAARCASCHDPAYGPLLATWRARLDEAALHAHGDAQRIERLRRSGPHGFALARELLQRDAGTR